jgi:transposase
MSEFEWRVIEPLLRNKLRGVPRVDDRRVLNGIFWILRSGSPWRDLPERYGPHTTRYNRFRRWTKAGVWDRIMDAITDAYGGDVRMIDGTSVRVHHSAATLKKATRIAVLDEGSPERLPWRAVEGPGRSYYKNPCSDR